MKTSSRHILLDAAQSGSVRFLSGLHVILEEGKASTWVTITRTGKFTDPRYGEFEISRPMLLTMVDNFNKRVFGQDVFIDVAHRPNEGAAAKVLKLSVEGDRLRALCEWTPLGLDAIQNKGYRYLSIEYHEHYKDNETGTDFGPVMMGAGLVVRPAIKRLDPIELSEAAGDQGIPVLIHPELQTKLLQELHIMHKNALEKLKAKLIAKKLAAGVVDSLMLAAEKAVAHVADEGAATLLLTSFEESGTQLAEQIGSQEVKLSVEVPTMNMGMNADQVRQLMADETKKAADSAKALTEKRDGNVKLLSDTIGAVAAFDAETKKVLTEAVADLITPEMTQEQVVKLAQVQINQGNELAVARQLSALGYVAPRGSVHISMPFEDVKKLEGMYRDQLKKTSSYANGGLKLAEKLSPRSEAFVNMVLAEFDRLHAPMIANEVKMLSGGMTNISDTNLPVGFRREVIREALSDLRILELVQASTDFSATVTTQIPYELRDMSAVYNDGIVYEGQPIHRASMGQFMDTAYIQPMKLAMLVSNEVMHFTQAAAINWDAMGRNVEMNARIMRELICRRILNELQRSADSYQATSVGAESFTSQLGAVSQIKTASFPIVRPFQQRDLQGNAVGSPQNPIVVTLNTVVITQWDGTGKQAAGTYWKANSYNLGYIQFVTQAGVPVVPAATGTNTIAYYTPTNIVKVDSDIAAGSTLEKQMNKVIQAIGKRKAFMDEQRYVKPDYLLTSPSLNNAMSNAEQFMQQYQRSGANTDNVGDLGQVNALPAYSTNAPGVDMGAERVLIGQRGLLGYVVAKPFVTGQPFEAVDSSGTPIGKKQAYGEEYSAIKVPTPVAQRMTSVLVYSVTGR
ncbi:phage protease [Herminiimonas sp. CN]|uniref:phage protease n=1 Tax=Herminiimonas sp. CN TaxID=1349818 RepID=UPI000558F93A|nr:phage protease [Herminiimonas sp. CN]